MEQDDQPAPGGPAPERRSSKSVYGKGSDFVAAHGGAVLALVLVLVLVIVFLYARHAGWFGLGGGPAAPKRGRGRMTDKAEDDSDPETDRLIDSINSAAAAK